MHELEKEKYRQFKNFLQSLRKECSAHQLLASKELFSEAERCIEAREFGKAADLIGQIEKIGRCECDS